MIVVAIFFPIIPYNPNITPNHDKCQSKQRKTPDPCHQGLGGRHRELAKWTVHFVSFIRQDCLAGSCRNSKSHVCGLRWTVKLRKCQHGSPQPCFQIQIKRKVTSVKQDNAIYSACEAELSINDKNLSTQQSPDFGLRRTVTQNC